MSPTMSRREQRRHDASMRAKAAVGAVLARLGGLANQIVVPYPHWLGGDGADQGPSYCRECAQAHVDNGDAEFIDGGYQQDNDGCCHCEDCGRLLDYTLTDYGVEEELEHFKGDRMRRVVSPELAYHLTLVLTTHHVHPEVLVLVPKVQRALSRGAAAQAPLPN